MIIPDYYFIPLIQKKKKTKLLRKLNINEKVALPLLPLHTPPSKHQNQPNSQS